MLTKPTKDLLDVKVFKNITVRVNGTPKNPVLLAPLAGVTDHPFRRVCTSKGADLTYVEMISATQPFSTKSENLSHVEKTRIGRGLGNSNHR